MSNVVQIRPASSRDLAAIVDRVSRFKAAGLNTFQAMACSLDDSDWDKVFTAIRAQSAGGEQ
jgi:hypothetical protein